MNDDRNFVAIGLLTERDLSLLGSGFRTAFPVEACPGFEDMLRAIDAAEEAHAAKMNESRPAG